MKRRFSAGEIERMKSELAELPVGCVSCKTIKGTKRYYRQWVEAGRTHSEYLPADRVADVRTQIARRRELAKALKPYLTVADVGKETVAGVKTGEGLLRWASAVKGWKARTILPDIMMLLLHIRAKREKSNEFDIPFDRQALADYLCVDRSALSAELSKLRAERKVESVKNHFKLIV